MNKLIRQLRKELTNNPKKSALLGGGLLVATYFWAPLVSGWISKPESQPPKTTAGESPLANAAAGKTVEAKTESLLPADWSELAQRLKDDPLRNLAGLASPKRDPFATRAGLASQFAEQGEFGTESRAPAAAPRSLTGMNLKLEAILIRGQNRTAIINGVMYRERELIAASGPPDADAARRLRVLEIHADHVKVGWGDETLRLELERAALAPGDRIVPISLED
jgi:hypothetical protein